MQGLTLFWFRRDLRLEDNKGLYHALQNEGNVVGLFIFDSLILDDLEDKDDARVTFLHDRLLELKSLLASFGGSLIVRFGKPLEVFTGLLNELPIRSVYTNRDWEPYALDRDASISKLLHDKGVVLQHFKDHLIFDKDEVLKSDGKPYTVFTPYSKAWKARMKSELEPVNSSTGVFFHYPSEELKDRWATFPAEDMPSLSSMGFVRSSLAFPESVVNRKLIREYDEKRNFPAIRGTSRLGLHFRFGTISIREKARNALELNETFLNELIWRDFYAMVLAQFPHVVGLSFKPEYDRIAWINNERDIEAWKMGKTGYPIVDAGMRELAATGFMHNRVRMITASFLTKHLLVDWRIGEAWFARKLLDFDLASNNGGWQWAAGCGTDAAPYFRIFSPAAQQEKFDPHYTYVRQWVPEWGTSAYVKPIVDHKTARERCLATYKLALSK